MIATDGRTDRFVPGISEEVKESGILGAITVDKEGVEQYQAGEDYGVFGDNCGSTRLPAMDSRSPDTLGRGLVVVGKRFVLDENGETIEEDMNPDSVKALRDERAIIGAFRDDDGSSMPSVPLNRQENSNMQPTQQLLDSLAQLLQQNQMLPQQALDKPEPSLPAPAPARKKIQVKMQTPAGRFTMKCLDLVIQEGVCALVYPIDEASFSPAAGTEVTLKWLDGTCSATATGLDFDVESLQAGFLVFSNPFFTPACGMTEDHFPPAAPAPLEDPSEALQKALEEDRLHREQQSEEDEQTKPLAESVEDTEEQEES